MSPSQEVDRPKRYFALHFRMLRLLGLGWWHHPDENNFTNFPTWYIPYSIVTQLVWVVGFVGLETIDPFIGNKEVERFMFSLSFVITHDLTLIKLYLFYFRNREIQEVVRTLEIELYDFYQNHERNRATVRTTRIMTCCFLFFGWAAIGNSNINGAIQDFRWRSVIATLNATDDRPERALAQPIYIPWGYQEDRSYIATFILEAAGLLWTGHIVMIIDTFIGSVILHMSGQFMVLQEALASVYERTMSQMRAHIDNNLDEGELVYKMENNNYLSIINDDEVIVREKFTTEEIEKALDNNLRNCIMQQQVLIRCVEKFSTTYSYGFLTQLLSSMAAICVIMVQVAKDVSSFKSVRFATSLAFFFAMITQLAIQCFTGNELTLQALRVGEAGWACSWERAHPGFRRQLVLVIARAQRPLRLTAAGFANMDNGCFLSIVKAAYSYYAVLSQSQV